MCNRSSQSNSTASHLNAILMGQVIRQKVEEEGSQSLLEPVTGQMICDAVARQMQVRFCIYTCTLQMRSSVVRELMWDSNQGICWVFENSHFEEHTVREERSNCVAVCIGICISQWQGWSGGAVMQCVYIC